MEKLVADSPGRLLASHFYKPGETARIQLISGKSGTGKTHWCSAFAKETKEMGLDVKGLISIPVFKNDLKIAINLQSLENGITHQLASRVDARSANATIGKWIMNAATLRWGNGILENIQACQILIIDEIGPLEFNLNQGLIKAFNLVKAGCFEIACIVVRPTLISEAQRIWPSSELFDLSTGQEYQ